jgi:HSP20 family protein
MSLLWRDFDPFFGRAVDDAFSDFPRMPNLFGPASARYPTGLVQQQQFSPLRCNIDLVESADQNSLVMRAEIPGVAKDDIQVEVDANRLSLRAEKRAERSEENERFHHAERFYGRIQRQVSLPFAVDPESVQANYSDGILSVSMQKLAQPEEKKRIAIQ